MKLVIGIADGDVTGIEAEGFDLPAGVEVVLRDFDRGNVPDEHGDLYEDRLLGVEE